MSKSFRNDCDQDFNNRDKPKWEDHDFAAICLTGNGAWMGLYEPRKPFYSDEWKGKEVTICHGQGEFLKWGNCVKCSELESMFELRPCFDGWSVV